MQVTCNACFVCQSVCYIISLSYLLAFCLFEQDDEVQLKQTDLPDALLMALQLRVKEKRILQQTVSFASRRKQMATESTDANGAS